MAGLTATYSDTTGLVTLTASALGSAALTALFERSVDGVAWTQVRGAGAVAVTAGAATATDREFSPGVANSYRVSGRTSAAVAYVAAGAGASGNNASVVPGLPAGIAEGDGMLLLASTRGAGTVNTPAGYAVVLTSGNVSLFGKRVALGEGAPTVTFAGGSAGDDTLAQLAAWRGMDTVPYSGDDQLNASAQNVAYPAVSVGIAGAVEVECGWKQDDWTSVAPLAGMAEIGEVFSTAGSDAGQVWDYLIQTAAADIPAGSFVVTGGAGAISRGLVAVMPVAPYLTRATASVTPAMTSVWLRYPTAPFLDQPVTLLGWDELARTSRNGVLDVVGVREALAVTEVHGGRRTQVALRTQTVITTAALDLTLSCGQPLFLQVPPSCALPSMYAAAMDYRIIRPASRSVKASFLLQLAECQPPAPEVSGVLGSYATLLARYATYSDVLALGTYTAVLALVGSAADLLVTA